MSLPWESKGNYSAHIPVNVVETAFEHCWERITSDLLRLRVGPCLRRKLCMYLTAQERFFVAMAHVLDSANKTVLCAFLLVWLNQPLITAGRGISRNSWGSMLPLVYWTICVCLWQQREVVAFGAHPTVAFIFPRLLPVLVAHSLWLWVMADTSGRLNATWFT